MDFELRNILSIIYKALDKFGNQYKENLFIEISKITEAKMATLFGGIIFHSNHLLQK